MTAVVEFKVGMTCGGCSSAVANRPAPAPATRCARDEAACCCCCAGGGDVASGARSVRLPLTVRTIRLAVDCAVESVESSFGIAGGCDAHGSYRGRL